MSNVFGNIRYLSHYKSFDELNEDSKVPEDKIVLVVEDGKIIRYQVTKSKVNDNSKVLKSGLYGTKIEESEAIVEYSTKKPIQTNLGGIYKGDTFTKASIEEVLDKMFYPSEEISFDCSSNLNEEYYLKGTRLMLTTVYVKNITGNGNSIKLIVNGNLVREDILSDVEYTFKVNKVIESDATITVVITDGVKTVSKDMEIKFAYPVYYGTSEENYRFTSVSIQRLTKINLTSLLSLVFTTNNDCMVFALEESSVPKAVLDESSNEILDDFFVYSVDVYFGNDKVAYKVYRLNKSTVRDYKLRIEVV